MCPFCYIGKRRLETALKQYDARGETVEIIWRSFQLDPDLETNEHVTVTESLAMKKGWSLAQTRQIMSQVVSMAAAEGLTYDFDRAVVANSFDAHRFTHYAKSHNLQDAAEERLFAAYFTEGKNTADIETLATLGAEIGLNKKAVSEVLQKDTFADAVEIDIALAQVFGIRAVPFFVFNSRFAVSGAQDVAVVLDTMEKAR